MTINMGIEAIDRPSTVPAGYTFIVVDNPANASGTITDVDVYVNNNIGGLELGIFYNTSGLNFKCRSAVSIGASSTGFHRYSGLSLAVEPGDYIGCFYVSGAIDRHDAGGAGAWYEESDNCVVDNETLYQLSSGRMFSLYGTGEEEEEEEEEIGTIGEFNKIAVGSIAQIDGAGGEGIAEINEVTW